MHNRGLLIVISGPSGAGKGRGEKSAQSEIKEAFGITTYPIVTMAEVVEYLYNREINGTIYIDDNIKLAIEEYYQKYGV